MPSTYRIDKNLKTIFVISKGNTKLEELYAIHKNALEDPKFKKGYNSYIDFSVAKPGPNENFDKIKIVSESVLSTEDLRGACKWAVYAPGEDAFVFSNMFARLIEHSEIDIKVFKNEYEAKKWLETI